MSFNVWDIVKYFEDAVAKYAGAPYGVAVDSCTNAIFLCCKYLNVKKVQLPNYTYVGVAQSVINAGGKCEFLPYEWRGCYRLAPYAIYDSARRFRKNMVHETETWRKKEGEPYYYCVSFHATKHLPIGRGGMVLTNDQDFVLWARRARYDGRWEKVPPKEDHFIQGWHMMLEPEFAVRGLRLLERLGDYNEDLPNDDYGDLSLQEAFSEVHNRLRFR